ncbi:hypothetical protein ES703_49535 [subsurface metagenome]
MLPPARFSVRDIQQTIQPVGYIIVVTTDIPCHLFMRWTLEKPRTHKDPVLRRGAYFPEKVRFCFVKYVDNEQGEAGDTLIHTFVKLDWPICQTRYFYFWGTIASESSPSESPLFYKHFPGIGWGLVFKEPWSEIGVIPPPPMELVLLEPWTTWGFRTELIFLEPWTYYAPPPPPAELVFIEPWSD